MQSARLPFLLRTSFKVLNRTARTRVSQLAWRYLWSPVAWKLKGLVQPPVRLSVACGNHPLAAWLNCDHHLTDDWSAELVLYADCTKRIPLASESVDCIHCEHFIEHVEVPEALAFLREAHRVLRNGRPLRLVTPDLEVLLQCYSTFRLTQDHVALRAHSRQWRGDAAHIQAADWLNDKCRMWGHTFIYDAPKLTALLREAGFRTVHPESYGLSRLPELRGLEVKEDLEPGREAESLVLEAIK